MVLKSGPRTRPACAGFSGGGGRGWRRRTQRHDDPTRWLRLPSSMLPPSPSSLMTGGQKTAATFARPLCLMAATMAASAAAVTSAAAATPWSDRGIGADSFVFHKLSHAYCRHSVLGAQREHQQERFLLGGSVDNKLVPGYEVT